MSAPAVTGPLLEVDRVTISFGALTALNQVSLEIHRDEGAEAHAHPVDLEQGPGRGRWPHRAPGTATPPTSRIRTSARIVPVRPSS